MRVEQFIERIEAARVAGLPVDLRERFLDRVLDLRRFLATPLQPSFDYFFFARAFSDALGIGFIPARQIIEGGNDALKLGIKTFLLVFDEILQRDLENESVCARRNRQPAIVVGQIKRAFLEMDLELTALEHASVLIGQDWQQHFVAQFDFERSPIDVKIARIYRARSVFEHIHPPLIERLGDAHVVRDKVE